MRRSPLPIALYLISAAALIAVLPLILHGCSCGHDFDFHLVSWMEAAAQFKAGNLHPAWAFSPAWNAGEPRFVFYPPLSWSLGAVLGLLLPWFAVPIFYTGIALAAAGFGMYSLARTLKAGEAASVLASVVYLANPYMLFTAYERTAYAELLAAAWIPLLLAAVLSERVNPLPIAIPIALLWLTNAPAAVMGCYSLGVLALFRLLWLWFSNRGTSAAATAKACAELAARIVTGLMLGLGLAAFYILPAAYERRWVQIAMATVEGMRIQDNFLFHHTADALHDEVLHTASLIAVAILAATIILFAAMLLRSARPDAPSRAQAQAFSLSVLAILIGFLLTPASAILWRMLPELAFLQFPWRLTAVLAAILCAGVAMIASRIKPRVPLLATIAIVVICGSLWPSFSAFNQACDEEDTVASRLAVFNHHMGTDPTDEYTTGAADNDALAHADPPFWLTKDGNAPAPAIGEPPDPAPMHFSLQSPRDAVLVLNLREFPAWRVFVNRREAKERVARADGLIAVPIHAGKSQVDISYAMTGDRKLGDGTTVLAICVVIAFATRRRHLPPFRQSDKPSRIIEDG